MEGAMLRANLSNKSVSRVELDQRAHDTRLRLERIERLLVLRAAVTDSYLRRVLWLFSFGRSGEGSRARRTRGTRGTLSNQRPCLPPLGDNRLTMHRREPFDPASRRLMKRATMFLSRERHIVPAGSLIAG
jgi:hypothetical protein